MSSVSRKDRGVCVMDQPKHPPYGAVMSETTDRENGMLEVRDKGRYLLHTRSVDFETLTRVIEYQVQNGAYLPHDPPISQTRRVAAPHTPDGGR